VTTGAVGSTAVTNLDLGPRFVTADAGGASAVTFLV
jgi:hypothetical protein